MFEVTLKLLLPILATLALVLVNGVFVAAEFAIVRMRRTRLEELAGQGTEAAKRAILVVDGVSAYLAVTQIGITAASLGVGWLGERTFADLFIWLLPGGHAPSVIIHVAVAALAFLLITTMHVVLGGVGPEKSRHQEARTSPALPRATAPDSAYCLAAHALVFREALGLDPTLHGTWGGLPAAPHRK